MVDKMSSAATQIIYEHLHLLSMLRKSMTRMLKLGSLQINTVFRQTLIFEVVSPRQHLQVPSRKALNSPSLS